MANKQTRRLAKYGLSMKFNKGVDFSRERKHHGNGDPAWWPELTKVERPSTKGTNVYTGFDNKEKLNPDNKRTRAYRAHNNPLGREHYVVPPNGY